MPRRRVHPPTKTPAPLTYGDLPQRPRYGVAMQCAKRCAYRERFSATRGDYFMVPDAQRATCAQCGGPMELTIERTTFTRVEPADAGEVRRG